MPEPSQETAAARHIGGAAVLLAASGFLSAALGYGRNVLLAHRVGAGPETDAYWAAFALPDFLNHILAGSALAIAFLAPYTRQRAHDEARAQRFLATVLGNLGALAVLGTLLLWLLAGPLVDLQYPGFAPETRTLTVRLTRIVLPAQVFFIVGGVLKATLFARGRFLAAALAPLVYNGGIIAGGWLLAPGLGVEGFAWGVLAGAFLGPFFAVFWDTRRRVELGIRIAFRDPDFLRYLWVALPLMIAVSLVFLDEQYGRWFGASLGTGAVAHLGFARVLMRAPVQVVGQAVAVAALPALAQLWAEGKVEELNRVLLNTLRATLSLGLLGAAALLALGQPLVVVMYQHGAFSPHDTETVVVLLSLFALAVPGFVVQQVAVRAFYARGDTWRPMLLGTVIAVAAVPLYLALRDALGTAGLAAASALGLTATALATLGLARWVHRGPELLTLGLSLGRTGLIAALAASGSYFVAWAVGGGRTGLEGRMEALAMLVVGGLTFGVVALLGVFVVADAPTRQLVKRALGRARPGGRG